MVAKYKVQHEFDNEPTYVCDSQRNAGENVVTIEADIPAEIRRKLAKVITAVLNDPDTNGVLDQMLMRF